MIIGGAEGIELGFETGFAMVDGSGQLDIGVGEENVRGDNIQMGDVGGTDGKRLPVDNGDGDTLVGAQLRIIVEQHLGAVGLAVDVDEQHLLATMGETGGERNGGSGFADASFL